MLYIYKETIQALVCIYSINYIYNMFECVPKGNNKGLAGSPVDSLKSMTSTLFSKTFTNRLCSPQNGTQYMNN